MKKKWIFRFALSAVLGVGTITLWSKVPHPEAIPKYWIQDKLFKASSLSFKDKQQAHAQIAKPVHVRKMSPEVAWESFRDHFGSDLKPQFGPSGQLISVQGVIGKGSKADSSFRPQDPKKAIERAREILQAAQDLIGIDPEWPLESPAARGSLFSAQVFFNETHQGVVVSPAGTIKIDLGSQGELIGLYSNYAQNVSLANQVRLDSEEAQIKAISMFQNDQFSSIDVDGGGKIIWVEGKEGRYAYQFSVNGYQVVIDAQNGNVLFRRDRRIRD
jgi:hypothetical protein